MERVISSTEFIQNPGQAQQAAEEGPVIITDQGAPAFVLLKHNTYRRISSDGCGIITELLRQDDGDFDFDPPRFGDT
jgi:hypothetical protein